MWRSRTKSSFASSGDFSNYPTSVEGRRQGDWILMDYVDFIIHVFSPEKRAFYGLERLRKSATTLSVNELNAELKAAIEAKRPKAVGEKKAAKSLAKKIAPPKQVRPAERAGKRAVKKAATAGRRGAKAAAKRPAKTPGKKRTS